MSVHVGYGRAQKARRARAGGISLVARASGVSKRAIAMGLAELRNKPEPPSGSLSSDSKEGGGRKKTSIKDPNGDVLP